jgi:hypothetical protein
VVDDKFYKWEFLLDCTTVSRRSMIEINSNGLVYGN